MTGLRVPCTSLADVGPGESELFVTASRSGVVVVVREGRWGAVIARVQIEAAHWRLLHTYTEGAMHADD